jgi:hypothetical protein
MARCPTYIANFNVSISLEMMGGEIILLLCCGIILLHKVCCLLLHPVEY